MKVYISGQITGLELSAAESIFLAKETELVALGHNVVNPLKVLAYHPDLTWKDYMLADIKELFECDKIVMLSNWVHSKGAKIEHDIAKGLGLEIEYH